MSEFSLRLKARIGSLKSLAILVLIFAIIFLFVVAGNLNTALKNRAGALEVTVEQLVTEIDSGRYVTVSGVAEYGIGYTETEDGRTVAEYYFLFDNKSNYTILVKADTMVHLVDSESVTISGVTRNSPSLVKNAIEDDLPDIQGAGFETTSRLYLGKGQTPPSLTGSFLGVAGLGILSLLCIVTFFFPATVFAPTSIDPTAAPASFDKSGTRVSGQFLKLEQIKPTIEVGKGKQKFRNAIGNIIQLDEHRLMIYIHHIRQTKTYGVTVGKQESDWGIFIDPSNIVDAEAGILYGWKEKPAVCLRYRDADGKTQDLVISFERENARTAMVALLTKMGFAVNTTAVM